MLNAERIIIQCAKKQSYSPLDWRPCRLENSQRKLPVSFHCTFTVVWFVTFDRETKKVAFLMSFSLEGKIID